MTPHANRPEKNVLALRRLSGSRRIRHQYGHRHRIDPHVDREREWIETDLLYAGTATAYARVDRPHIPKSTANATGDVITTDGQLSVLELGTTKPNIINSPTPALQTRPAEGNK